MPGFVDLDEVTPLKAAIPELIGPPEDETARRLRTILERVRRLALVRGLRGVEQTPETSFVLGAALRAYPEAGAVHVIRDGRDVVTSLLERGWLNSSPRRRRRRTAAPTARTRASGSSASAGTSSARVGRHARGVGLAPVRDRRPRGPRADGRAALRGARHRPVGGGRAVADALGVEPELVAERSPRSRSLGGSLAPRPDGRAAG